MVNSKKYFSPVILCLLAASLSYYGCSKQRIEKQPNAYEPVSTYLDPKKQQEQEFTIDSTGTGPITGNQGTKISQSKQCLMFPNGDSVTWPFIIKLVELYKAKDMIYYQMPTTVGGNILRTDGEIRLRAFKDGTELVLKPDPCMAQVDMPNSAPRSDMRVFYGLTDASGHPDWSDKPADVGVTSTLNPVFSTNTYGYSAGIAKLGWINCGVNASAAASSGVSFVSSTDELTNLGIFIYIPATKTVMQVYGTTSGPIPNGSNVKVIVIGIDSQGKLFKHYEEQQVNSNLTVDVVMVETTDADLTALLDGL